MREYAGRANDVTAAPAAGGNHPHHAGSDFLKPPPGNGRGQTQEYDGDSENPDDLTEVPVVRGTGNDAVYLRQRRVIDAPRVNGTDTKVNRY